MALGSHAVMHAHIHDDFAISHFKGVADMKCKARVDIAPDDIIIPALAQQQPNARAMVEVPFVGESMAGDEHFH